MQSPHCIFRWPLGNWLVSPETLDFPCCSPTPAKQFPALSFAKKSQASRITEVMDMSGVSPRIAAQPPRDIPKPKAPASGTQLLLVGKFK